MTDDQQKDLSVSYHQDLMASWRRVGLKIRGRSANPAHRRGSNDGAQSDSEEELHIHEARCEATRKKIGIVLKQHEKKRITLTEINDESTRESPLVKFITGNFCMKKCCQYAAKDGTDNGKCFCGDSKEAHEPEIDPPMTWMCLTPKSARSFVSQHLSTSPKSSRNSVCPLVKPDETPTMAMQTLTVPNDRANKLPPLVLAALASPRGEPTNANNTAIPQHPSSNQLNSAGPLFVQDSGHVGPDAATGKTISPRKWSEKSSILEYCSTNAFGTVEFANDEARSKPAKYVRICDTASEDAVIELMTKYWKMLQPNPPSLVISVVGGAKNFKLDGKKRETFNRGLVKAAQATHAWIITTGFCMGVMKAVGEAVKEGHNLQLNDQRVNQRLRCIGIGHWGYVKKREDLITTDEYKNKQTAPGCWPATYLVDPIIRHGQPASLDPNHTHFILVDDGYRNVFRPKTVAEFRAKLERKIAQDSEKGGLKIPVVAVLVEGGIESFEFVKESVNFGIPVVLCQGTGRAADILSYAFKHHKNEKTDGKDVHRIIAPQYQEKVIEKLTNAFSDSLKTSKNLTEEQMKEHFHKMAQLISECCQKENMVVVFDINHQQDLDLAIMSSLLQGHARKSDQLNLALKWNRSDVAAEHIFTPDAVWTDKELHKAMQEALKDRKTEFVKLLLQHGVIMNDFLTTHILTDLYNKIKENLELVILLKLPKFTDVRLETIYARLEAILKGKFTVHIEANYKYRHTLVSDEIVKFASDKVTLLKPFRELFLWAILTNRQDMAKFFWQRNEYPLISALAASRICKVLARKAAENDLDSAKQFIQQKNEFEHLAVSIINYAYELDNEKGLLLVEQEHPSWGDTNCLVMASMANDRNFLATSCAQKAVNQIWKRGLNCSGWEILLGVIFPPYMLIKRHFFDTASLGWSENQKSKYTSNLPRFNMYHKIRTFYSAPVTKFCMWNVIYCCFLLLYSYVLLFDLKYRMSYTEIVLHLWVLSMIVNKFWMYMSGLVAGEDKTSLVYILIRNFWARVETYSELLHLIGFALRWLPYDYFDWTKVSLCIAGVFFYLRLFRAYMASSYLGPQLFVIRRMIKHVIMFLLIVIVVMLSYGISFQTMMFPQRDFYGHIFFDLLYYPYWEMHGDVELGPTVEANVPGCSPNVTQNEDGIYCPRKFWAGTLMMAAYMLVSNTLLINLLIAVFSHVFDEVQTNSKEIWKFEMWLLATEFEIKPIYPPPIAVLEIMVRLCKWLCYSRFYSKGTGPQLCLHRRQREQLRIFEKECLNEYLHSMKEKELKDINARTQYIQEKVDSLAKAFDDDRNRQYDQQASEKEKSNTVGQMNNQWAQVVKEERKKKKRDPNQPSSKEQLKLVQDRMCSLESEIGTLSDMLKTVLAAKQQRQAVKKDNTCSTSSEEDDEKSLHSD